MKKTERGKEREKNKRMPFFLKRLSSCSLTLFVVPMCTCSEQITQNKENKLKMVVVVLLLSLSTVNAVTVNDELCCCFFSELQKLE